MLTQAWEHRAALDAAGETVFAEPHTVLASLPLPLFITAQPSNLLAHALKEAGKEPVVEFCRWRKDKGTAWPSPSSSPANRTSPRSRSRWCSTCSATSTFRIHSS